MLIHFAHAVYIMTTPLVIMHVLSSSSCSKDYLRMLQYWVVLLPPKDCSCSVRLMADQI